MISNGNVVAIQFQFAPTLFTKLDRFHVIKIFKRLKQLLKNESIFGLEKLHACKHRHFPDCRSVE